MMRKKIIIAIATIMILIWFFYPVIMLILLKILAMFNYEPNKCSEVSALICINEGNYYVSKETIYEKYNSEFNEIFTSILKEGGTKPNRYKDIYALLESTDKYGANFLLINISKYKIDKDNNIIYFISGPFKNGNYEYAILEYKKNNLKKYSSLNEMDSLIKDIFKDIKSFNSIDEKTNITIK